MGLSSVRAVNYRSAPGKRAFRSWTFVHKGQPRAAVGFSFGLLLALFARLKLIPDPANALQEAVSAMKKSQEHLRAEVPAVNNPAKRYAGQLMGRWVTVFAQGRLRPLRAVSRDRSMKWPKPGLTLNPA